LVADVLSAIALSLAQRVAEHFLTAFVLLALVLEAA